MERVVQHQRVPEIEESRAPAHSMNAVEISLSRGKAASAVEQQSDPVLEYQELRANQSLAELLPDATLPSIHELRSLIAEKNASDDVLAQTDSVEPADSPAIALESAFFAAELIRRHADVSLHAQGSHLSREVLSLIDENKGAKLRAKAIYQAQANLLTRNSGP
jgi:hypothetical protein